MGLFEKMRAAALEYVSCVEQDGTAEEQQEHLDTCQQIFDAIREENLCGEYSYFCEMRRLESAR